MLTSSIDPFLALSLLYMQQYMYLSCSLFLSFFLSGRWSILLSILSVVWPSIPLLLKIDTVIIMIKVWFLCIVSDIPLIF